MIHKQYIEHLVTDHCNLKCDGCSMHSPYLDSAFSDIEIFEKDLYKLKQYIRFTEFRFVGGEPTLHPNIVDFLKITKNSRITQIVSVCTNAASIFTLSPEFFKAVDLITISKYPETNIKYDKITEYLDSIKDKYNFEYAYEDKEDTFIKLHSDIELEDKVVERNFLLCKIAWDWGCISFKDGRLFRCGISQIKNKFLKQTGQPEPYDFIKEDSILLHSNDLNEQIVRDFIYSKKPLKTCKFCWGTSSHVVPRKQLTMQEIKFMKKLA